MGLIDRAKQIYQLNSARQQAAQDAAISRAADFWNRVPSAFQSNLDHQYAYQDAMIEASKKDGVSGALGLTAVKGNGDQDPPRYKTPTDSGESYYSSYSGSGSGSGSGSVTPREIEYINAELAKHYKMDTNTAYQEALANTAYQREVKDMKAAGLNPAVLYGGGRAGNGADSFRGSSASFGRSGSGGGYSRRSGSSNSSKKLFTTGEYYGISTAVGIATAVVTKNPANYWLGSNAAQGVMTAVSGFFKGKK